MYGVDGEGSRGPERLGRQHQAVVISTETLRSPPFFSGKYVGSGPIIESAWYIDLSNHGHY